MSISKLLGSLTVTFAIVAASPVFAQAIDLPPPADSGVIRAKSAFGMDETLARIKKDIQAKGLRFFDEIDQSSLAAGAGIKVRPSVLLMFGNPPLGIQFLTSTPYAGLDWPVRMLVFQDDAGQVWIAYTDFKFIAHRHHIADRSDQFKMASEVAASVAASADGAAAK